jgi:Fur family ferric uptake transcriptional regulator
MIEKALTIRGRERTRMPNTSPMTDKLQELCAEKGMRMTGQRRIIASVLAEAHDHPDVEEVYKRASAVDNRISLSTVYRTVKLLRDAGILERREFGDGRARYERVEDQHHDHLIDVETGAVIEFQDEEIERLQEIVARRLGYELTGHKLELYGRRLAKRKRD